MMNYTEECVLSHSRNASFARVCHPRPVAFSFARTSASKRMVVDTLGVAFTLPTGRPRRTNLSPSYKLASATHCAVTSGASSVSTQGRADFFNFAFIGFPHGNNTASRTARSPDQHYDSSVKPPRSLKARFGMVFPDVLARQVLIREHLTGTGEIKPAFSQGFIALVCVEFDFYFLL